MYVRPTSFILSWFVVGWIGDGCCVRIPLSYDAPGPFLHHSSTGRGGNSFNHISLVSFSWSSSFLGRLLHQSVMVEIGPRGVRFIRHQEQHNLLEAGGSLVGWLQHTAECLPSDVSLCYLSVDGWLFPSEGKWAPPATFEITSNASSLQTAVMQAFAEETACHGENLGAGRVYTSQTIASYTVTSCDILHGNLLVVYVKGEKSVFLYQQTFGPIAYLLILLSATLSTGAIASLSVDARPTSSAAVALPKESTGLKDQVEMYWSANAPIIFDINALCSIVVCCLIYIRHRVHFHNLEDALVFWLSAGSGCVYILLSFRTETKLRRRSCEIDGCMYSLATIAIALYRSPETPYVSILVFFMACRIWTKVFLFCHGEIGPSGTFIIFLDMVISVMNYSLLCEIGLKPQFVLDEVWPFYCALMLFLTYSLIKYQWLMVVIVF